MEKFLKIYGERNTNTNYLSNIIDLNLNIKQLTGTVPPLIKNLQSIVPGDELLRDLYFYFTFRNNLGWKHKCIKPSHFEDKLWPIQENNFDANVIFLTITKNPYSWLLSLYRNPYHQHFLNKPSFELFLQRQWRVVDRENIDTIIRNPMQLWNIKNKSYFYLNKDKTIHTSTEAIFESPQHVVNKLSQLYQIEKKSQNFINYETSTKDTNKTFSVYRDYYLLEKWRENLSIDSIAIINEWIDKDLMNYFGYEVLS